MHDLPDPLRIEPRGPIDARVRVPGSKSVTNRALLVAALAEGNSELSGALASDDTEVMIASLGALGCAIDAVGEPWRVTGTGGRLHVPATPLFTGNSGTTARFLTAAACLADGPVTIDGSARMRERPIDDLTRALEELGARCEILGLRGCPPVRVAGGGLRGGAAAIDARRSSQYVSAVLLAAPYAARDVALRFDGGVLVSRPYVDLTLDVMRAFGASADWEDSDALRVRAGAHYRGRRYAIEADASSAAYPFCAAAIAGGSETAVAAPATVELRRNARREVFITSSKRGWMPSMPVARARGLTPAAVRRPVDTSRRRSRNRRRSAPRARVP